MFRLPFRGVVKPPTDSIFFCVLELLLALGFPRSTPRYCGVRLLRSREKYLLASVSLA